MGERKVTALDMFVRAARKFVAKVETGQARSHETYRELKDALAQYEKEAPADPAHAR